MVSDVRAYPNFIRWITSLSVTEERTEQEVTSLIAHATVGWKALTEKFATKVTSNAAAQTVRVDLVRGPFRVLRNHWRFDADPRGGTLVRFDIAYEFANPVLNTVARMNRDRMADKIMQAFEDEAKRRFATR